MNFSPRYVIGIDLGTTNICISYIDLNISKNRRIEIFKIPQLVSRGEISSQAQIPSCLYRCDSSEKESSLFDLPWQIQPTPYAIGSIAVKEGLKTPTKFIESAKSWLCYAQTRRNDPLLPLSAPIKDRISPLEATKQLLSYVRDVWNFQIAKRQPEAFFEEQIIIITVPASFDEVARGITIEAAQKAGCRNLSLLEEPQAAFYHWLSENEEQCQSILEADADILVCDIGGGTTDFSLLHTEQSEGQWKIQRKAIGNHLLLGGDNIDHAIAHFLEEKLNANQSLLTLEQKFQLRYAARQAKEELLLDNTEKEVFEITLQGSGKSIIQNSIRCEITKQEVVSLVMDGFWKNYPWDKAILFKKMGLSCFDTLPYETETSIIKHMAKFLKEAHNGSSEVSKPKYVLFNGGTMLAMPFQKAIIEALNNWFGGESPTILSTQKSLKYAVSKGAAYFGLAKQGQGIFIRGGIARNYYLKVDKDSNIEHAINIVPRGAEEGFEHTSSEIFLIRPNTPVSFTVLQSNIRLKDTLESIVSVNEEEFSSLPPVYTFLKWGKQENAKAENFTIPVKLKVQLSYLGILEISLISQISEHLWKLSFATQDRQQHAAAVKGETLSEEKINQAKIAVSSFFSGDIKQAEHPIKELESILEVPKNEWPGSILRHLWSPLKDTYQLAKKHPKKWARWWNLAGLFLLPGFGFPLDENRISDVWKLILQEKKEKIPFDVEIQRVICFRRIAGGFQKGQQSQLMQNYLANFWDNSSSQIKIKAGTNAYEYSEKLRLFAAMEWLDPSLKSKIAHSLLQRIKKQIAEPVEYWVLARICARFTLYASVSYLLPISEMEQILKQLIYSYNQAPNERLAAIFPMLFKENAQQELNLSSESRKQLLSQLPAGLSDAISTTEHPFSLSTTEQHALYGDNIPSGILLQSP